MDDTASDVGFVEVEHPTQGRATVPETAVQHMAAQGWTLVDADAPVPVVEEFDPAAHTLEEVLEHIRTASVDEEARVVAAEKTGLGRPEIVG